LEKICTTKAPLERYFAATTTKRKTERERERGRIQNRLPPFLSRGIDRERARLIDSVARDFPQRRGTERRVIVRRPALPPWRGWRGKKRGAVSIGGPSRFRGKLLIGGSWTASLLAPGRLGNSNLPATRPAIFPPIDPSVFKRGPVPANGGEGGGGETTPPAGSSVSTLADGSEG